MFTKTFVSDESGAVTVDWVVLTAALVGLGIAVMTVISGGLADLSGDTTATMQRDDIVRVEFTSDASALAALEAAAAALGQDVLSEIDGIRDLNNETLTTRVAASRTNATSAASARDSFNSAYSTFQADGGFTRPVQARNSDTGDLLFDPAGDPIMTTRPETFTHNGATYSAASGAEAEASILASTATVEAARAEAYQNEAIERGL